MLSSFALNTQNELYMVGLHTNHTSIGDLLVEAEVQMRVEMNKSRRAFFDTFFRSFFDMLRELELLSNEQHMLLQEPDQEIIEDPSRSLDDLIKELQQQSMAHLFFVFTFDPPRTIDNYPKLPPMLPYSSWNEFLGESPLQATERLRSLGAIVCSSLNRHLEKKFTRDELNKMIEERNLTVSGNKTDLIERLIKADEQGMWLATIDFTLLECTPWAWQTAKLCLEKPSETVDDKLEKAIKWVLATAAAGVIGNRIDTAIVSLVEKLSQSPRTSEQPNPIQNPLHSPLSTPVSNGQLESPLSIPENRVNLEGASLKGAYLKYAYLNRVNLRYADLKGANLSSANLRGADLTEAELNEANLWHADLRGANLTDADLWYADLRGAALRGAALTGAELGGANLRETNLRGVNLKLAKYNLKTKWPENYSYRNSGALGPEANLTNADLSGEKLNYAELRGANLKSADLSNARLKFASLQGANLKGAELYGTRLDVANLKFAILKEADLSDACLWGADLRGADLASADLREADLGNANLRWTNLRGVKLALAKYNLETKWPANFNYRDSGAVGPDANLTNADLSGASLWRGDLRDANLSGANLSGANLSGANLSGANLNHANLKLAKYTAETKWPVNFGYQNSGALGPGANLTNADLSGAFLWGIDLRDANLSGANLSKVNLSDANLSGANLTKADLRGARYDRWTRWPECFDPQTAGAIEF